MILGFIYLIYLEVGVLAIAPVLLLVVLLFIQSFIDNGYKKASVARMEVAEKRTKSINEIISGVKIIKFNAWEKIVYNKIRGFRSQEGDLIFDSYKFYNLSHAINALIPTFLGVSIFLLYEGVEGKKLDISTVYELVALFNAILAPIRYFVMAFLGRIEAMNSARRIGELANLTAMKPKLNDAALDMGQIEISNGCFNWEDPEYFKLFEKKEMDKNTRNNFILKDINLKINQGEFVAVIGRVGAGKSSLLLALMDEMVRHQGSVKKHGDIAYISQEAFLQNQTIRENIVFGKPFEKSKFDRTLRICEMITDLEMFPAGDLTEIGERGLNMSGGQKQRVNIARAVYSDSDIYLIDDALSALDAYVGKQVMDNVFLGALHGKTRIMVTHFLHLLEKVDKVILMDEGEIKAFGTLEEVKKMDEFKAFASKATKKNEGEEEKEENLLEKKLDEAVKEHPEIVDILEDGTEKRSILTVSQVKLEVERNEEEDMEKGKLIEEEHREQGIAGLSNFAFYGKAAGTVLTILTITLYSLSIGAKILCDWWVGAWSEERFDLSNNVYLILYAVLGVTVFALMILRAYSLAYVAKLSALWIFKKLFWNILRRPMRFFDTTALGVIINRCTNDVEVIDDQIPLYSSFFFTSFFTFLGSFILASVISPILIVFVVIGFLLFTRSCKRYVKTSVDITRISQVSIAPLISIASELIEGATVIRTYGKNDILLNEFSKKMDIHQSAHFLDLISILWIRFRVETFINFAMVAAVFTVVIDKEFR